MTIEDNAGSSTMTPPCLLCGCRDREAVTILADLTGFYCINCEHTFTRRDVEQVMLDWAALLARLNRASAASE